MCECFEVKLTASDLRRHFPALPRNAGNVCRHSEIHPNDTTLILTAPMHALAARLARWGLVGSFLDVLPRSPLTTLPAAGLEARPFYSRLLRERRCLIPLNAFCTNPMGMTRQGFRYSQPRGKLLFVAGLFDVHPRVGVSCAMLTLGENRAGAAVNARQPLILHAAECAFWLAEHADFPAAGFSALLDPASRPQLQAEPRAGSLPSPQLAFAFG